MCLIKQKEEGKLSLLLIHYRRDTGDPRLITFVPLLTHPPTHISRGSREGRIFGVIVILVCACMHALRLSHLLSTFN